MCIYLSAECSSQAQHPIYLPFYLQHSGIQRPIIINSHNNSLQSLYNSLIAIVFCHKSEVIPLRKAFIIGITLSLKQYLQ